MISWRYGWDDFSHWGIDRDARSSPNGPTVQVTGFLLCSNCIHIVGLWCSDVSLQTSSTIYSVKPIYFESDRNDSDLSLLNWGFSQ